MTLRLRRGTDIERESVVFAEGELVYTTDTKVLYIGDGTTPGGILVSQTEETPIGGLNSLEDDVNPQLGGNLNLNNFEITGNGNISITGTVSSDIINSNLFVGDGSGLTNLPIPEGEGVVEGSNYRINIVGDDSTIIVNTSNNELTANTSYLNNIVPLDNQLKIFPLNSSVSDAQSLIISSRDNFSRIVLERSSENDISEDMVNYGSIVFSRNDINGDFTVGTISGTFDGIFITAGGVNSFSESTFVTLKDSGNFGIGTFEPEKSLDVHGDAIIRGDISIKDGHLILDVTDLGLINPEIGKVALASDGKLYFNDINSNWQRIISSDEELGIDTEFVALSPLDQSFINDFGDDSSDVTGAIIYNSTTDRFQFFQAGSWVSLPNNGSKMGQILAWNGIEWAATDPAVASETVENADLLNGFSGSFYLDYNNFTNTPTIPSDLTDLGIVDGTTGQVLTTDGSGNFSFSTASGLKSRAALSDSTGSISDGASANVNIAGYRGYMLYKIETSAAAWVRLYVNDAARTADAGRTQGQDPLPGSGVIAEVITTGAETVIVAPGVVGFNNESPITNIIPAAVTNLSGSSTDITVTLTAVELEI